MAKKKKTNINKGKVFEKNFEDSVSESGHWYFRVRDVNPVALKNNFAIPRNPYDTMIFDGTYLFTLELKSTQNKSITHRGSNPQIKEHQIEALHKASEHENIVSGLVINFREVDNRTFFIPIWKFLEYDAVSKGEIENPYKTKFNEKSIPLAICEEIGIEILNAKKRVHHRYFINDFLHSAITIYKERRNYEYYQG